MLFRQLDPHWDYLSFDLLTLVVKDLSLQNAIFTPIEEKLAVYNKDLQDFRMHTELLSFCQAVPYEEYDPPEVFWKIVTEYQWPETVTLEDVEVFRKQYAPSYKLQTLALMVKSVMSSGEARTIASEVRFLQCLLILH